LGIELMWFFEDVGEEDAKGQDGVLSPSPQDAPMNRMGMKKP
jgi:hypothetical protein